MDKSEVKNTKLTERENDFYQRLRYWLMYKLRHGEIDVSQAAKLARSILNEDENLDEKIDTLLIDMEKQFPELAEVNFVEKSQINSVINALVVETLIDLIEKGQAQLAMEFNKQVNEANLCNQSDFVEFKKQFLINNK